MFLEVLLPLLPVVDEDDAGELVAFAALELDFFAIFFDDTISPASTSTSTSRDSFIGR